MTKIVEPQKEFEVLDEADVLVVGGGPAGIAAALAAGRNRAKTILIERYASLGGLQTQCHNPVFSFIDSELHGGIMMEIIRRLRENGALKIPENRKPGWQSPLKRGIIASFGVDKVPERLLKSDEGFWGDWGVTFDGEYYKYLLDIMMEEAGVRIFYHAFAVGALKEGNTLKGIIIESKQGRQAILGKVIIDCTGDGDIVWKSGAKYIGEDGFPAGPNKGRHVAFGYAFYIGGVDVPKFNKFRKENPQDWGQAIGARRLIKKAKREGNLYFKGGAAIVTAGHDVYNGGRVWVMAPFYRLEKGRTPWMIEEISNAEIEMRKQARSLQELFKENVPGFENSYIEKTPVSPAKGNGHRLHGEYILKAEDVREGRAFEDSIGISNMPPDIFGPEGEHRFVYDTIPFDIPYRCLISKDIENLLAAGTLISAEYIAMSSVRYCAPSMTTGQAAGTAAALSAKNNVSPKDLDIGLLQKTLKEQVGPISVKELSEYIIAPYRLIKKLKLGTTSKNFPKELM